MIPKSGESLSSMKKSIENALPANKMGKVDELLVFNDNARDSLFFKGSNWSVNGFFVLFTS